MKNENEDQPLSALAYSVPDSCRRLGLGRTTVYELIRSGELTPVNFGRRTVIPEAELRGLIERRIAENKSSSGARAGRHAKKSP